MTRQWEYKTISPPRNATQKEATDPESALTALGAEGWEVTATVDYVGGGTKFIVLKRPKDTQNG
jgi:hypothetical protein